MRSLSIAIALASITLSLIVLDARAQIEPVPGCGEFEIVGYRIITRGTASELEGVINVMQEVGWTLVGPVDVSIGPFPGPDGQPYESYTATLKRSEPAE